MHPVSAVVVQADERRVPGPQLEHVVQDAALVVELNVPAEQAVHARLVVEVHPVARVPGPQLEQVMQEVAVLQLVLYVPPEQALHVVPERYCPAQQVRS